MKFAYIALSLVALAAAPAHAQVLLTETERIVPAGLQYDDQFGFVVAVDGNTLAATALNESLAGPRKGSVSIYVHDASGWVLQQKLESPDYGPFGYALSLEADQLAIGSPNRNYPAGAVDVFTRSAGAWTLEGTIAGSGGGFGQSIDLQGDRLVIGAAHADSFASNAGAAFVYERQAGTWVLVQQLTTTLLRPESYFGTDVVLDADVAVVGAPGGLYSFGAAFVFRRVAGSWQLEQSWSSSATDSFGRALALKGDLLAVGAPYEEDAKVSLFRYSTGSWMPEAELTAPDPRYNQQFGSSLDLLGEALLVGPRYDKTTYVFEHSASGWGQVAQLAPTIEWTGQHEQQVALSSDWIVVGNRYDGEVAPQGGALRIYARPLAPLATVFCTGDTGTCPCGNNSGDGSLAGCTHSEGWGGQLAAAGSASVSADDLRFFGRALPPGQPVLLATSPAAIAPLPAGDGLRCIGGGTLVRLGVRLWGDQTWGPGLLGHSGAGAGETWTFQAYLRDIHGPCGARFTWSEALSITMEP